MDVQLVGERAKQEDQRKNHDKVMRSVQNSQRESVIGKEEANIQLQELKDKFNSEV